MTPFQWSVIGVVAGLTLSINAWALLLHYRLNRLVELINARGLYVPAPPRVPQRKL